MQSIKINVLLLLIFTTLFSCEKLDELTEIEVNDNFSATIKVNEIEDSNEAPANYSVTEIFSIAANEEIRENFDKIQSVKVNSLAYEFNNYVGVVDGTITNAFINVGDVTISLPNINIDQADIDDTVFYIDDEQSLKNIATAVKNSMLITVVFGGTIDETPVKFDIIINVDVTALIDVI